MQIDSFYTFRAISAAGIFTLWIVMMLNGTFVAMLSTAQSGAVATGTPIKTTWTGIRPVDFLLSVLITFFSSVISIDDMPDLGPWLISVDLVVAIAVFNMMTLVEDRRNRKTGPLRSPTWWQTMWNAFGAAVALPVYLRLYVEKRSRIRPPPIPYEQAQALPLSAVWNSLISVPLLLPTALGATPLQIQTGMIVWLIGPLTLGIFQDVAAWSRPSTVTLKRPVVVSYWIVGGIATITHIAIAYVYPYISSDSVSWSRIYMPNHAAVKPGLSYLVEGATIFLQYDFMLIKASTLAVGYYMFHSPNSSAKGLQISYPMLKLLGVVALGGPGAAMAWLMCLKEQELENTVAVKSGKLL